MFRPPIPLTATVNPKADLSWEPTPRTAAGCAAWDYWRTKIAPGRAMPRRGDLDPLEMRGFLPTVFLIDVIAHPQRRRFRYRLAGTIVTNLAGREMSGRMLDDVFDPPVTAILGRIYAAVAKRRQPLQINTGTFWNEERVTICVETLLLPLAQDGETVDMLFGISEIDETSSERT